MHSKTIVTLFILMTIATARAYQAPGYFLSGASGFMSLGLQQSCFAIDLNSDVLPCNPAFIAKERDRRFAANIYLGNNVTYLREATDLSQGRSNEESIKTIFNRNENSELRTQIELGHVQETFGWSITPLAVNYHTSFQNQALPEISLYASLEESAKMQFGSYLGNDWFYGVQLRYLHRRFVASQFYLLDALVSDGRYLFEPRQQNLFFIEPAILFAPSGSSLKPEFTALIANGGFTSHGYDELPVLPEFHLTSSITPDFDFGRYGLGLDINFTRNLNSNLSPITLGGFYEYGILRLFGSVARYENAIGFGVYYVWWNLGITQRNEAYVNPIGEVGSAGKTYLMLGIEL